MAVECFKCKKWKCDFRLFPHPESIVSYSCVLYAGMAGIPACPARSIPIPACPFLRVPGREGGREKGREKEKGREERKGREEEKGEGREERKGGKGEEGRRKEGRDSCRNSCISQMGYQTLGENAAEDGEKKETR